MTITKGMNYIKPKNLQMIRFNRKKQVTYYEYEEIKEDLKNGFNKYKKERGIKISFNEYKNECLEIGALWAGANVQEVRKVRKYGEKVGFLFQLVDDIIDRDGYVLLVGVEETYRLASQVRDEAKRAIASFGPRAKTLGSS